MRADELNDGVIMQIGRPLEVYNNPNNLFVAGFIGSPAMNFLQVYLVEENSTLFAEGEKFKLAIPANLRERFVRAKGRQAVLGIRPEHLCEKGIKPPFPGGETLRVSIDVVEPVGSEVILTASCGSANITASVDPQTEVKPGMVMELLVDMNRMHLFNKETGGAY